MVNPYLVKLTFFVCFDQNIINIKCQTKNMAYTVLESHAYNNVLVIKYFCTTTKFSLTHVRRYSNFSNPGLLNATLRGQLFLKKNTFQIRIFEWKKCVTVKKIGNVIWRKLFWLVRSTALRWVFQVLKPPVLIGLINW